MIKVLIVDGQSLLRAGLRALLDWAEHVFDAIRAGAAGFLLKDTHPD
jgi:YesN/AraC family two-component response regulator